MGVKFINKMKYGVDGQEQTERTLKQIQNIISLKLCNDKSICKPVSIYKTIIPSLDSLSINRVL